jgi:hypothetical protein
MRITLAGNVSFTPLVGTVSGGNEDLAATEEAAIDREGAGAEKRERSRGRETEHRTAAIDTRQHGLTERSEDHKGIAQADKRAADGGEDADRQGDAADDQRGGENRAEEVSVRRRDGEPALDRRRDADGHAQQQEADTCAAARIGENRSAP